MNSTSTDAGVTTSDILIMGNGLSANLAAAFFNRYFPDLEVVIVGPEQRELPLVGESTVEFAGRFFHQLGLGGLLEERHYNKYGLTFIHKENLDDPDCRRYVVSEAPGHPRMPSYQINRVVFDRDLRRINEHRGTKYRSGKAHAVSLRTPDQPTHRVAVRTDRGDTRTLSSRWLVDASGRSGVLARKLDLRETPSQPEKQRSAFWFRLRDFENNFLSSIETTKPVQRCFDSYYATQHVFGNGNWIWLIPMRPERGERNLLSIGITWRPDLFSEKVTGIEEFRTVVASEHPFITDLVDSGDVVDENALLKFVYSSRQYYSDNGWYLLGDAAFSPDPLFSTGTSHLAVQITQIGSMIRWERNNELGEFDVAALDTNFGSELAITQDLITNLYDHMASPFRLHWALMLSNMAYFYFTLPARMEGLLSEPAFSNILTRIEHHMTGSSTDFPLEKCVRAAEPPKGEVEPTRHLPNHFGDSIDWTLYRSDERTVRTMIAEVLSKRATFRSHLSEHRTGTSRYVERAKVLAEKALAFGIDNFPYEVVADRQMKRPRDLFRDGMYHRAQLTEEWPSALNEQADRAPRDSMYRGRTD